MRYLDTAFAHLQFAIKLNQAAEEGRLSLEEIDRPLSVDEGGGAMLVLQDRVLNTPDDLILACQNYITMAFGAAAITLNRCREEAIGKKLPDPVVSECDQWAALVFQIRNAFAHDIAEPRWQVNNPTHLREFKVAKLCVDLRPLNGTHFDYAHIGGAQGLFLLKQYGEAHAFGRA